MNASSIRLNHAVPSVTATDLENAPAEIIKFPKKKKGGRPSKYTAELANEICQVIMTSDKGIGALCKEQKHWPNRTTIIKWINKNENFKRQFEIAKKIQIINLIEQVQDILHNLDNLARRQKNRPSDEDLIYLARMQIDEIKWKVAHLMPRKY